MAKLTCMHVTIQITVFGKTITCIRIILCKWFYVCTVFHVCT